MFLLDQWKKVLNKLENELTAVNFDLWVNTLTPIQYANDELILMAPSVTAKNQVNQPAILDKITKCVHAEFTPYTFVRVTEAQEYQESIRRQETEIDRIMQETPNLKSKFNKKYTFENFVVGKSNQVVCAAMQSVAEHPSQKFNPLFIYGGVGLGKTHLLHAVGNYLNEHRPDLNVLYVTCEKFTNDYVDSIRNGKEKSNLDFRDKYRSVDVLMIDDIQFISNKMGIQEEFFHTFNDLYQNNKQIIIASDRSPKEMSALEERLRSRFSSGLIQDIQEPDYETKVAILNKKCSQEGYLVDKDVIDFIAQKTGTNIREMEGILSKVVFYASLQNKTHASMEDAHEALKDYGETEKTNLDAEKILNTVCDFFKVTKEDLIGKKKNKEIVEPRQLCIYLINDMLNIPLTAIGAMFGGRDHTTIMHARDKISNQVKVNPHIRTLVNDIRSQLLKY
ncbi:MAG TPA: chromosomal replication initiator protein DnaA [Candidatus Onthoplasma faecipullorum]|nr:chromosomal replication initiator protein DnaA [Candidatus Onthoplasma faecipullorum]